MLLLISPINHDEAVESIEGGADIVDVKNPKEGSLGANFPWVIKDIRELTPDDMLVSATLGDVPYKPGTVSLAAMGALVSGADYIKVGLYGPSNYEEALEVMKNVVKTVKDTDPNAIVVASGYADAHRVGAVSPWDIPKVARDAGADLAMLDTAVKDGHTLFDYLDIDDCKKLCKALHQQFIFRTPTILIVVLNRGKANLDYQGDFEFYSELDLSNYVYDKKCVKKYFLIGIISHIGESGSSGHFISYCRNQPNTLFYCYNDASVFQLKNNDDAYGNKIINEKRTPYILFYKVYN